MFFFSFQVIIHEKDWEDEIEFNNKLVSFTIENKDFWSVFISFYILETLMNENILKEGSRALYQVGLLEILNLQ